jgi:hypothetical protein
LKKVENDLEPLLAPQITEFGVLLGKMRMTIVKFTNQADSFILQTLAWRIIFIILFLTPIIVTIVCAVVKKREIMKT